MLPALFNHLWQSTLFAGVAGLLTLALHKNHARLRHSIWLVASFKFLIPLSIFVALGSHIQWRIAPAIKPSPLIRRGGRGKSAVYSSANLLAFARTHAVWHQPASGICIRYLGMRIPQYHLCMVGSLAPYPGRSSRRIARENGTADSGHILSRALGTGRVRYFPIQCCCCPLVSLTVLTPAQMEGVIAHELCHVRHRDNLTAAIHMFVEAIFLVPSPDLVDRKTNGGGARTRLRRRSSAARRRTEGIRGKHSSCLRVLCGSTAQVCVGRDRGRFEEANRDDHGPSRSLPFDFGQKDITRAGRCNGSGRAVPRSEYFGTPAAHAHLYAQPQLEFDVASVKENHSGRLGFDGFQI